MNTFLPYNLFKKSSALKATAAGKPRSRVLQSGSALFPFVVVVPFLILIATYFMDLAASSFKLARKDQVHTYAQFTTDAGIDYAMEKINLDGNWAGTGSELELQNDGQVRTTYQVTVTINNPESKTLTAIGRSYRPVSATTPEASVTIKVDLRAITSGGTFSLISGVGGLSMQNSAKIVGGDVLVNGKIDLKNSAQIGLTTNPLNVSVAHQNCPVPADATYPRLCASGENGQPISFQNSARIYGDVKANNQTNGASMSNPGLTASSGVLPGSLPPHDRAAQKAAITSTITGAAASCSGSQTRTWNANTKITGNVTVQNSCTVTVNGDVWITGSLDIKNSGRLIVSNALGTTRANVMIDGSGVSQFQNSATIVSNSSNTGLQFIAYWSAASCSPDCSDVTGVDLYNSRGTNTLILKNSASGPQSIFYARWSKVEVENSGNIGALVGQTVDLKNSGTITFGTSVTGGTSTTWIIDGYRRSFN